MSRSEAESSKWLVWACVVVALVVLAAAAGITVYDWYTTSKHSGWADPGIRGDFLGGHLGPAAAMAGTVLFFAALLLQGRELQLQRHELKQGREVAEAQAEALRAQARMLRDQNEQLRLQNQLSQRRDDVQFVIALAKLSTDAFAHKRDPRPAIRQAVGYVAQRATKDYASGLELLDLLLATTIVVDKRDFLDAVKTAAQQVGDSLTTKSPLDTAGPWADVAVQHVEQAYS
ncbi:MAG: hypothetical protein ABIG44_19740 [Planctomycetota bacterium]